MLGREMDGRELRMADVGQPPRKEPFPIFPGGFSFENSG
jgi:hypothetical protein